MSALLSVEAAQAALLALAKPLPAERRSLLDAHGGYLAAPLISRRTQPAQPMSAMDGYAIRFADMPGPWQQRGSIAAGDAPGASIGAGETMRIFTGAPLPHGADTILVQEDARAEGDWVRLSGDGPASMGKHVRPMGGDFSEGAELAPAGSLITAGVIALAAMAGHAEVAAGGRARVAILLTGDELVPVGAEVVPGQIPESNGVMLAAMLAGQPVASLSTRHVADDRSETIAALADARADHDVIVTVGGASVGDHDHIHAALTSLDALPAFWKIAMRPGKPLLAAQLGDAVVLGLPGNPASAFVTAHLFLLPLLRHLSGATQALPVVRTAPLTADLPAGGARREYLRAVVDEVGIAPCSSQDSGFVTALAAANALLIREIAAPARGTGTMAPYIVI